MYRIMATVGDLPNANKMYNQNARARMIVAYRTSDPSIMYPISILDDITIRGLCDLNKQINIQILWLIN